MYQVGETKMDREVGVGGWGGGKPFKKVHATRVGKMWLKQLISFP